MGVTLQRVFAPLQGGGFLTANHVLFFVYDYNYCSVYWTTLCLPPRIIQALKNPPVGWLMLYLLHSSKNPISLLTISPSSYCTFCQGKPCRACNDYDLIYLCWCEMTNLSVTFFISQTFALTLTDNTFVILKTPCCYSWDIQGQSLSCGFKAFLCTTLLPGLGALFCLATF